MLFSSLILSLFAMTSLQSGGTGNQVAKAMELGKVKTDKTQVAKPVQAPVSLKVAIVDWETIYDSSRWIKSLERSAQRELLPRKKKLDDLNAQAGILRQELSLLSRGTVDFLEASSRLRLVEFALQQENNLVKAFVGRKLQEMTYHFNRTINDKIASYARQNGIHLVLRKNSPSMLKNVPLAAKVQAQERNSVLYFAPSLDITKQVVELLDAGVPVEANTKKSAPGAKGAAGSSSGKGKNPTSNGKGSNR